MDTQRDASSLKLAVDVSSLVTPPTPLDPPAHPSAVPFLFGLFPLVYTHTHTPVDAQVSRSSTNKRTQSRLQGLENNKNEKRRRIGHLLRLVDDVRDINRNEEVCLESRT